MKKRMAAALTISLMVPVFTSAGAASGPVTVKSIEYKGMQAPKTIPEMVDTYTKASIEVTYSNGLKENYPLSYNRLFKSEDKVAVNKGEMIAAGAPIDVNGNVIMDNSVEGKPTPYVSDAPDSNSMLHVGNEIYMITHYEYQTFDAAGKSAYGLVPASMSLSKMKQDPKTGKLTPEKVEKIDFSDVNGIWIPCNGSLSPWGTHLGSEEYEPDARSFEDTKSKTYAQTASFAKLYFGDEKKANPYYYGWIPEITVKEGGETEVVKHYSTGRFSHEQMTVMPDNRTAFFGDDGGNTMMFMYVADKEKDLSSGTLYASKFKQTGTENGGSGDMEWIRLGHGTDSEVKQIIDSGTKFSSIFEVSDTPKEGFTAVKTYANANTEYLKLKPNMEKAAAFLEPRRYAAMMGATSEWNKMEGLAFNPKENKVYVAMSDVSKTMEKDATGKEPADHIQLPKIKSGVTYELNLAEGQKDQTGAPINSAYAAKSINGLLTGEDMTQADAYGNTANPDKVANPDNLTYSAEMNALLIGEDSGMHTNNFVWAYDLDKKKLERLLSVPAGAEATGLRMIENMMNHFYMLSNFQHPGDGLKDFPITAVNKDQLIAEMEKQIGINKTGGVGYVDGFPSVKAGSVAVHNYPIGRMNVNKPVQMYKMDASGTMTKAASLKKGFYRVYGEMKDYYNVGGSYYVKKDEAGAVYNGRILLKSSMEMYSTDGKVFKTLKAGEAIRVYGMEDGKYNVGNGYYVKQDRKALYYEGMVMLKKDVSIMKDGKTAKTLKKGSMARVYSVDGNKLHVGGGYYIDADKASIAYMKN
ncbi:PhoX family protein [Bacillus sp. SJS]|uniref:PhoX family protein n=1 Tax=Bacillus sp. SJS TaxID=1423321 RepID=UPI000824B0E1|nr:alkaline phosphatase PhoX [Bacillus sp. SJS]